MKHILLPTKTPSQWRAFLADPVKQWKRGRSAFELAYSWEGAPRGGPGAGLPAEVRRVLESEEPLAGAELLLVLPEHQVTLDTARAPSQNDLWALLTNHYGLISLAIEAKAGESFDATVNDWLDKDESRKGREARLEWLCQELNCPAALEVCGLLRYQLFHRTVSALKEAKRYRASAAVVLVQSFSEDPAAWADFERFAAFLGAVAKKGALSLVPGGGGPLLYLGWVQSPCVTDARMTAIDGPQLVEALSMAEG